MKIRITIAASLVFAAVAPASALAQAPTKAHIRAYEHAYHAVAHEFGHRAPGRNIVKWGLSSGKKATDAEVVVSLDTLGHMLAPALVAHIAQATPSSAPTMYSAPVPTASYAGASYGGGYSIPAGIVQCESGGNWRAVNPSSGAGGAYQIMPSTWSAYGGQGLPQNASPAEQSRIAAAIWAKQGPSAWVC